MLNLINLKEVYMNFLEVVLNVLFPMLDSDEIDFGDVEENYYLLEPEQNMTGDSLDGGDIYNEPDYVIKY